MSFTIPTVADFKQMFQRDFPYAVTAYGGDATDLEKVTDTDIAGAIQDAQFNVNPGLFPDQPSFTRAFLYLAAHQLVEKILMAAAGVQSQYSWLTAAKGAGGVTESFVIPEKVKEDPFLAHFSKTRYGAMYLQIVSPLLVGNVGSVFRATLP